MLHIPGVLDDIGVGGIVVVNSSRTPPSSASTAWATGW